MHSKIDSCFPFILMVGVPSPICTGLNPDSCASFMVMVGFMFPICVEELMHDLVGAMFLIPFESLLLIHIQGWSLVPFKILRPVPNQGWRSGSCSPIKFGFRVLFLLQSWDPVLLLCSPRLEIWCLFPLHMAWSMRWETVRSVPHYMDEGQDLFPQSSSGSEFYSFSKVGILFFFHATWCWRSDDLFSLHMAWSLRWDTLRPVPHQWWRSWSCSPIKFTFKVIFLLQCWGSCSSFMQP